MHEYVGNLHVHSKYSDGSGTIDDIAREATKAGVDFVGITDHHTLTGLKNGEEGWHGKALILIGMEIGDLHNHYLAWRVNRVVEDNPNPQVFIDGVKSQGGLGFIAHPFEIGCKFGYSGRAFTWDNWNVSGFNGICIWNFTSQWKGPITSWPRAVYYFLNRRAAVTGPDEKTLAKWDSVLAKGKVVGIGGTDAHAFRFGIGFIRPRIFPYSYLFRTINTHILTESPLTGEAVSDRKLVYSALEKGRCFVSYDLLGNGRGFSFTASGGAQNAVMGDDIALGGGVKLVVKVPGKALVKIMRNGVPWREAYGAYHMHSTKKPGVYRAEVFKRGLTGKLHAWIFSNPVYVRP